MQKKKHTIQLKEVIYISRKKSDSPSFSNSNFHRKANVTTAATYTHHTVSPHFPISQLHIPSAKPKSNQRKLMVAICAHRPTDANGVTLLLRLRKPAGFRRYLITAIFQTVGQKIIELLLWTKSKNKGEKKSFR